MQASNMGTVTYQMTKWQDMENTVSHQLSVEYTHFSKVGVGVGVEFNAPLDTV